MLVFRKKVLVITALRDDLRKLKGKALVDNDATKHPSDPEMLKIDVEPITPKLLKKQTAHSAYIKHTQEEATIHRDLVEHVKSKYPLDQSLESACRLSKLFSVKFRNDHVAKILGYGDYQIGNVTISRVYYVEGLGHNLFFVGKFCDSNLEVAFRQHTCFIRNLESVDPLTGSRGNNLYTLSLRDMMASSPICLLSKASKTKSWLWHRRLSHLNFGAINHLARHGLVRDDFSRFTWVKFLRSKDEAPDFIIKFLKMIQVWLKVPVRRIRTDNGTELVNQSLREYYEKVGISNETSVARSPQQNGVVEIRNRMLIEAARTMFIYAKAPFFLWAEAVATEYFDELTAMASKHSSSGPTLHEMTPATFSSGLVSNPHPSTPFVPPSRSDWDIFFQPMFDELLTPPPSIDNPALEVIAPIAEVVAPVPIVSTSSPSSTNVDQDAPSPSNSQTTPETQHLVIPNDVEEDNHDIEVAHMGNDPYFGIPIPEVPSDQSLSTDSIHTIVHPDHQISKHNSKWTKIIHLKSNR
ncbi:retrovirus-related pol polyprotein from transposon TNT 1-94 [Tanacetum coccineum]|uniref:Retrovirus-related pol polyprotein from transposon TNT 1-94 n=1 Tax=Tanacetum coccineum TaxID=301880 RepID=A0ABQ5J055_9ASTR